MHGRRTGRKSRHDVSFPYGPLDLRIRRTAAVLIITSVLVVCVIQGCRQESLIGFSSPSSGVGFCLVIGFHSFQKHTMLNAVTLDSGGLISLLPESAAAMEDINWARPVKAGEDPYAR